MVGTKGGLTFLASKACQSICCKTDELMFSFPSLLLCVLRNNTSLYSPWRSDAFSHPQHLSLQLQAAALDFFVAADKTCRVSVEKFGGRERKDECYCVRANTKMRWTVKFILPDLWAVLAPWRNGQTKFLAVLFQPAKSSAAAKPGPVPEQTHLSPCRAVLPCLGTGGDLGPVLSTECGVPLCWWGYRLT